MNMIRRSTTTTACLLMAGLSTQAWDVKLPWGDQSLSFHGFASQGLLYSDDYNYLGDTTDWSPQFSEFGLNVSFSPFNRTRITAQAFSFDIGDVGNHDVFLDYASIEYTFHEAFGIRGGRVRRPGGIYNHIQDVDVARTSILLPQGMYDARWRDFSTSIDGGILFGNVSIGKAGGLSYEAFAGIMRLSDEGGIARSIQNGLPSRPLGGLEGIDSSVNVGAQLWWSTPVPGLRAGLGGGVVPNFAYAFDLNPPLGPGRMESEIFIPYFQASIEYTWKSWTFQAEYYTYTTDIETFAGGALASQSKNALDSWYVSAAYRFNSWLETGVYYTEHYADTSDRSGRTFAVPADAYQRDLALSARFDITDWWIFKLEGHYLRGTALIQDNAANPVRDKDGWFLFAAKTTFSF